MKKQWYMQPNTMLLEISQNHVFCASDLTSNSSNGLESWTEDEEGVWN